MIVWWVATALCLNARQISLKRAKAYLNNLEKLDHNISVHSREVDRIAQKFAFLSQNDKKIRARLKYLENVGKVCQDTEEPKTPDIITKEVSRSTFSRAPPKEFAFINRNKAPVRVFEFRTTKEQDCNFNEFTARFHLAEDGQIEVKHLKLNNSNSASLQVPLPTAVAFSELILVASTNYGDLEKFCPPEVVGDDLAFPSFN
jgi:hypothetical protein